MTVLIIICAVLGIICGELVASAYYRIPAGIKTFSAPKCKKCGKEYSCCCNTYRGGGGFLAGR